MQLAAFLLCVICVICGRIHIQTYSIYIVHIKTPVSPADLADLRRQTTKPQNSFNLKQPVFLCDIMQLAAFLCVICVICGRIHIQTYSIYIVHIKTPVSPADLADLRRRNPKQQNYNTTNIKPQTTTITRTPSRART